MKDWPEVALINDVTYQNGDRYLDPSIPYAGTGFLIQSGGKTLAVTVKHVLWVARNKATQSVEVNDRLKSWKMYPKGNPADSVVIEKLINEDPDEPLQNGWNNGVLQRDWLVFTTRYVSPRLHPLPLRDEPVSKGDRVFMAGNPYRFEQTVKAQGTVVRIEGDLLMITLKGYEKAFLGGASGSPVVDEQGRLVGIFSNSQQDEHGENRYIINSTAYLKKVLAGERPLNTEKVSVAVYVDSLMGKKPVRAALREFGHLFRDEDNYFRYSLTYIDHGGLIRIGEQLIDQNRVKDAVRYFEYFDNRYPGLIYLKPLTELYNRQGKREKAIQLVKKRISAAMDPEVRKELETLAAKLIR